MFLYQKDMDLNLILTSLWVELVCLSCIILYRESCVWKGEVEDV